MFGEVIGKAYTAIVSFSVLLLSNYTGNDAQFVDMHNVLNDYGINFVCYLAGAFENDFEEIFSSGIVTTITFAVNVKHKKDTLFENAFTHSVVWNTEMQQWIVYFEENDITRTTDNFSELKGMLSNVDTMLFIDTSRYDNVDIQITARLPEVEMPSIQRSVDLMLLWKKKTPIGRLSVNLREDI